MSVKLGGTLGWARLVRSGAKAPCLTLIRTRVFLNANNSETCSSCVWKGRSFDFLSRQKALILHKMIFFSSKFSPFLFLKVFKSYDFQEVKM